MTAARKLPDLQPMYEEDQIAPPQRRTRRWRIPATVKICLLAAICVVTAILYLKQQVVFINLNLELTQLQEQAAALEQRNAHLLIALEGQRSLQKIDYLARTQLGMVEPERTANLVLDSLPTPAAPEGRWVDGEETGGLFATLADWLNRVFPLGGVEAGTLQR